MESMTRLTGLLQDDLRSARMLNSSIFKSNHPYLIDKVRDIVDLSMDGNPNVILFVMFLDLLNGYCVHDVN